MSSNNNNNSEFSSEEKSVLRGGVCLLISLGILFVSGYIAKSAQGYSFLKKVKYALAKMGITLSIIFPFTCIAVSENKYGVKTKKLVLLIFLVILYFVSCWIRCYLVLEYPSQRELLLHRIGLLIPIAYHVIEFIILIIAEKKENDIRN